MEPDSRRMVVEFYNTSNGALSKTGGAASSIRESDGVAWITRLLQGSSRCGLDGERQNGGHCTL